LLRLRFHPSYLDKVAALARLAELAEGAGTGPFSFFMSIHGMLIPPSNHLVSLTKLGTNGQFNSHITACVGVAGQPVQKFMDVSNFRLNFDPPGYDAIWFNVYMTGFLPTGINPAANAWLTR